MPEVHFVPAVVGAGGTQSRGESTGKAIAGTALIAIALATVALAPGGPALDATFLGLSATSIAAVGLAVALSGIAGLLTKASNFSESFLFSGQTNVTTQGGPVPIVVGEIVCGGVIISAGLQAYDLASGATTSLPFDPAVAANVSYYSTDS